MSRRRRRSISRGSKASWPRWRCSAMTPSPGGATGGGSGTEGAAKWTASATPASANVARAIRARPDDRIGCSRKVDPNRRIVVFLQHSTAARAAGRRRRPTILSCPRLVTASDSTDRHGCGTVRNLQTRANRGRELAPQNGSEADAARGRERAPQNGSEADAAAQAPGAGEWAETPGRRGVSGRWHGLCEDSVIDGQQQPALQLPTQ